jgi:hypothetical protein
MYIKGGLAGGEVWMLGVLMAEGEEDPAEGMMQH